jgi:hypothetical protein
VFVIGFLLTGPSGDQHLIIREFDEADDPLERFLRIVRRMVENSIFAGGRRDLVAAGLQTIFE